MKSIIRDVSRLLRHRLSVRTDSKRNLKKKKTDIYAQLKAVHKETF